MAVIGLGVIVVERDQIAPFGLTEFAGDHIAVEDAQIEFSLRIAIERSVVVVVPREVQAVGDGIERTHTIVESTVDILAHHQRILCCFTFPKGGVQVQVRLFIPEVLTVTSHPFTTCAGEKQQFLHDAWGKIGLVGVDGQCSDRRAGRVPHQPFEHARILDVGLCPRVLRTQAAIGTIPFDGIGVLPIGAQLLGIREDIIGRLSACTHQFQVGGLGLLWLAHLAVGQCETAHISRLRLAGHHQILVDRSHLRVVEYLGGTARHALLQFLGMAQRRKQ